MTTPRRSRPAVPPVVLASAFLFDDTESFARTAAAKDDHLYSRWSNPTVCAVEEVVAELEGAERALACGSGMAAMSLALLAALPPGGTLLTQRELYGGTHELIEKLLPGWGYTIKRASMDELVAAAAALAPGSVIHLEIPSNPSLRVADLPAIRAAAPAGTPIVVDATFATPINLRPLAHGATLSAHSATKYMGGHHDLLAGVISGGGALMDRVWTLRTLLGPVLDPAAAYRLWRGLETLELRVVRQCETAETLAQRLAEHPAVAKTHHPCLPDHPDFSLAKELLRSGGAVLSFEMAGGYDAAAKVADQLEIFAQGPSLGGVRSLVSWPAGVSHRAMSEAERQAAGVSGGLLRLAVGVEPLESLWNDLRQALES
ncbi:MAG: PLP-dependent transferase [Myxococcota bacterium]